MNFQIKIPRFNPAAKRRLSRLGILMIFLGLGFYALDKIPQMYRDYTEVRKAEALMKAGEAGVAATQAEGRGKLPPPWFFAVLFAGLSFFIKRTQKIFLLLAFGSVMWWIYAVNNTPARIEVPIVRLTPPLTIARPKPMTTQPATPAIVTTLPPGFRSEFISEEKVTMTVSDQRGEPVHIIFVDENGKEETPLTAPNGMSAYGGPWVEEVRKGSAYTFRDPKTNELLKVARITMPTTIVIDASTKFTPLPPPVAFQPVVSTHGFTFTFLSCRLIGDVLPCEIQVTNNLEDRPLGFGYGSGGISNPEAYDEQGHQFLADYLTLADKDRNYNYLAPTLITGIPVKATFRFENFTRGTQTLPVLKLYFRDDPSVKFNSYPSPPPGFIVQFRKVPVQFSSESSLGTSPDVIATTTMLRQKVRVSLPVNLRSLPPADVTQVELTIQNDSGKNIHILWVDYQGQEQRQTDHWGKPPGTYVIKSFTKAAWVFREVETSELLKFVERVDGPMSITIKD